MNPQIVVVGSRNPVKIDAARRAFERAFPDLLFEVEGASVPSGVSDQPMTDAETLRGAMNRAEALVALRPDAEYCVGIEGGIEPHGDGMDAFAWIVVHHDGRLGRSRSSSFELPAPVVALIRDGVELGDANDRVFGTTNSKHEPGAVGLLTRGCISRTDLYEMPVLLALVPFLGSRGSG